MTYVIVGGPHDGQRVITDCPKSDIVLACFADIVTRYDFSETTSNPDCDLCSTERYIYTEICTQLFPYSFYRYHKLTVDQAIGALINGYHKSPTE